MWSPQELPASLSPDTPFCICSGQSKNGKLYCNIAPRGLVRPLKKLSAGGRIEIHPHILLELSEPGRSQGTGTPSHSHPNDIPPLPVLVPHTQRQALLLFLLSPVSCSSPSPWLLISNYVPWDFLHACVHGSSPFCYSGCCHRPTALPSSSHTLGTTFPSYLLTGAPAVSQWPPCPLLAPSVPLQCGWRDC